MSTYRFVRPISHTADVIGQLATELALIAANEQSEIVIRFSPSSDPTRFNLIVNGHAVATMIKDSD